MQRKKEVIDAKIGAADTARGLFLIHTGTGKGKCSAAFGVLARALGHGMNAVVAAQAEQRPPTEKPAVPAPSRGGHTIASRPR